MHLWLSVNDCHSRCEDFHRLSVSASQSFPQWDSSVSVLQHPLSVSACLLMHLTISALIKSGPQHM